MRIKDLGRITWALGIIVAVAALGSIAALVCTLHMRRKADHLLTENVSQMLASTGLRTRFRRQKGLVGHYILSGGESLWLEKLDDLEGQFSEELVRMQEKTQSAEDLTTLSHLRDTFIRYETLKADVVSLFQSGFHDQAIRLYLGEADTLYEQAGDLTEELVQRNHTDIRLGLERVERQFQTLTLFVVSGSILTSLLGVGLLYLIFSGFLEPLKKMADEVKDIPMDIGWHAAREGDLTSLAFYLRTLVSEISEKRADEEETRKKLDQSEHLAAIGNAVAKVAHEIRNRLAVIGGFARVAEKRLTKAGLETRDARVIREETEKLESLLTGMMDMSHPNRIHPSIQPLNQILRDLAERLAIKLPDTVEIRLNLHPSTQEACIDPERLEQVLLNLVQNAVEALEGGGVISIVTTTEKDRVMVMVEDNGPGIPEEVRARLPEPFFTTKKRGNGLGLAISSQIIRAHGGEMRFENRPQGGTRATLILPGTISQTEVS